VKRWDAGGLPLEASAVCGRAGPAAPCPIRALKAADIPTRELGSDQELGDSVRLGTMHQLRGLEFRCIAVVDCDGDTMLAH
jgi:hypothetical protein